ncbi:MAG: DUF2924 domain-containing protein [Phycisphaerae bacterium]|nr:DUF2924 domain-containing protein [Phycisphaerae bacterium]
MAANVPRELAAMAKMSAGELRSRYRELFGEESRSGNKQWLFRRCAWRLQSLAEGGLSERALLRAKELARDVDVRLRPPGPDNMPRAEQPQLAGLARTVRSPILRTRDARLPMPGTVLRRKFKGHVYSVDPHILRQSASHWLGGRCADGGGGEGVFGHGRQRRQDVRPNGNWC